jgi:hypothetical protein
MGTATETVSMNVNASTKCKLGTVTATGNFRLAPNGPGGTVTYYWIRKDSSGTVASQVYSIVVAAGDQSLHTVVSDSWTPASAGTEQLFFSQPSFGVTPQPFNCKP